MSQAIRFTMIPNKDIRPFFASSVISACTCAASILISILNACKRAHGREDAAFSTRCFSGYISDSWSLTEFEPLRAVISAVWSVFIAQKICRQLQWPARNFACHTDDLMHTWGGRSLFMSAMADTLAAVDPCRQLRPLKISHSCLRVWILDFPLQRINHIWLEFYPCFPLESGNPWMNK